MPDPVSPRVYQEEVFQSERAGIECTQPERQVAPNNYRLAYIRICDDAGCSYRDLRIGTCNPYPYNVFEDRYARQAVCGSDDWPARMSTAKLILAQKRKGRSVFS